MLQVQYAITDVVVMVREVADHQVNCESCEISEEAGSIIDDNEKQSSGYSALPCQNSPCQTARQKTGSTRIGTIKTLYSFR